MADIEQQFGDYRLTERIGHGGTAVVYRGEHVDIPGRTAAVKILRADINNDAALRAFDREVQSLAHLDHPHIIRIRDFGVKDIEPYIIMDLALQSFYEVGAYDNTVGVYQQLFFLSSLFPDAPQKGIVDFQKLYQTLLDPQNKCLGTYGCSRASAHSASANDAVIAFTNALTHIQGNMTRDAVDEALTHVSFDGASGRVVFNGKDSNPLAKSVYLLCADKQGYTHLLFIYNPDGTTEPFEPVARCDQ